jgi:hypothetical protein
MYFARKADPPSMNPVPGSHPNVEAEAVNGGH